MRLSTVSSSLLQVCYSCANRTTDEWLPATPFLATLAQNGLIDYPLFGVSLTRDSSGSLTFGAIDGSVVLNRSAIAWNEVVPFAPFISESGNSASYLQWTVVLDSISVSVCGSPEMDRTQPSKHLTTDP